MPWLKRAIVRSAGYTLALMLLTGCEPAPRADPGNAAQVALGKTVYGTHCATCHGANLQGQSDWQGRKADGKLPAPPHDASGHTWHHDDETLIHIVKFGFEKFAGPDYQTDMPKYADILSEEQTLAVLAYIKSTWPKDVLERQASMNHK
jgi:mono/diheme cytochrome c family protein